MGVSVWSAMAALLAAISFAFEALALASEVARWVTLAGAVYLLAALLASLAAARGLAGRARSGAALAAAALGVALAVWGLAAVLASDPARAIAAGAGLPLRALGFVALVTAPRLAPGRRPVAS